LILPNAWDAVSARLMEQAGARAIATTSGGVSWVHGYPDGGFLPRGAYLASVREMAAATSLPLSVDVEDGYAGSAAGAAEQVAAFLEAGAVGINIEDGAGSPALLAEKIAAIRAQAQKMERGLFINVRTDVVLRSLVPGERAVEEILQRAELYRQAGADGLFVPGLAQAEAVRAVCAGVPLPVNLMAVPGIAGAEALAALGVRRISLGVFLLQAALARVSDLAAEALQGRFDDLFERSLAYGEINTLLQRKA
jgi:2-methylisocitrate lyase-like PEP mutase family enzyme